MRLGQLIELVQDEINDAAARQHSRPMVVRAINQAHLQAYMMQSQEDPSYHNCELTLPASSGRIIHTNILRYGLPHYLDRVNAVFIDSVPGGTRGIFVLPARGLDEGGWSLFAGHQLELRGWPVAQQLVVHGVKPPGLLIRGTLPAQTGLTTPARQIRMPASSTLDYPYDQDVGKYLNGVIEITGAGTNPDLRSGQIRRVVATTRGVLELGAVHSTWTVDRDWDELPVEGDQVDMRLETPEAANTLIKLIAASTLYRNKGAFEAEAQIRPAMLMAEQKFREFAQPRADHGFGTVYVPRYSSWGGRGDPDME